MEKRTEGIILYVVPYQDRHEIAGVFGPEGKISLIRKWGRGTNKSPLSPLTKCEFVWKEGRGEMGTLQEVHLLDPYLKLRDSLKSLHAAMDCLASIKETQAADHPAERLYLLLVKILEALPHANQKETLLSVFYLKLLLHDGLLPLESLTLEMAELLAERSLSVLSEKHLSPEQHQAIKKFYDECLQ